MVAGFHSISSCLGLPLHREEEKKPSCASGMTGSLIHNSVDDLDMLALLFDQCHRPAHAENQAA